MNNAELLGYVNIFMFVGLPAIGACVGLFNLILMFKDKR